MVPPVFKTGLAAIAVAGGFDSLPPPPKKRPVFFGSADRVSTASPQTLAHIATRRLYLALVSKIAATAVHAPGPAAQRRASASWPSITSAGLNSG